MNKCLNCGHDTNKKYCNRMITKICPVCGKEFTYKCNRANGNKKTCSRECNSKFPKNKCLICGKPAIGKYCSEGEDFKCVTCGKIFHRAHAKDMPIHCSRECSMKDPNTINKIKTTQIEKYGAYGFNTEKQKQTMINKYGYITPAKNKSVKEKIKATQYNNNDNKFAFNTEQQRQTMYDKYGSYGRLGDPEELKRQQEYMLKTYGVKTPAELPAIEKKILDTLTKNGNHVFGTQGRQSKTNEYWKSLIENTFNVKVETEYRIDNSFFDLYIPDKKLLIDINPTVTHNVTMPYQCLKESCKQPCDKHSSVSRSYHYDRAKLAQNNHLKLIQIYDWDNKVDILHMLNQKLSSQTIKISSHKLKLKSIDQKTANKFLSLYHIQKGGRKQTYCYGLYLHDELLAVATFSKARFKSNYDYEFYRFAIKRGYTLFGASDKMVKQFIKDVNPNSIISYIDFNHTTTDTFLTRMGFTEYEPTGPTAVFAKKNCRKKIPMTSLLSIGADRILGTHYGPKSQCGMNNEQIMLHEGWVKIFTAGNRVFVWNKANQVDK